jgi:hypothetical protein
MLARLLLITVLIAGCSDKATHENIDKWRTSEKGATKLAAALADESLDADLSAHAAANMVRNQRDGDVRAALDQMAQARRSKVTAALAPRLWEMARVEGDTKMPTTSVQIIAKDALVQIRKFADDDTRKKIDGYLIDWYCVPTYDDAKGGGRAVLGTVRGDVAMRLVGPPAGKKLIDVVNAVIAAPGQVKEKNKVGNELLLALAATCSPDAVKKVLDISTMKLGDPTLQERATGALFTAYVDPGGLFEVCDRAALVPSLDQLVALAKDEQTDGGAADHVVSLIGAAGMPACLPPLVSMIAHPHSNTSFKYVGAQAALRCGGVAAIPEVVRALPEGPYSQHELAGGVTGEIARLQPRDGALAALRKLLDDKKPLVRWVAAETLAQMKSVEDAPRLASLGGGETLLGFWGDQGQVAPQARKKDPTVGQRAKELADQLRNAPK